MVGSFWWKAILKLLPTYKQQAKCNPGIGDTTLFWTDRWKDQTLQLQLPELFSFAINREITLAEVEEHPVNCFTYHFLNKLMPNIQLY